MTTHELPDRRGVTTYQLSYRRATEKKSTPREVITLQHLSEDELLVELERVLPLACWVYVEDESREFAGKGSVA